MDSLEEFSRITQICCTDTNCVRQQCSSSIPSIKSLPNDQILDQSKFKAFAGDNSNVYQNLKFALGRVENIA